MAAQSILKQDSQILRRVARDKVSRYLLTDQASSRMRARGITLADVQRALRNGVVLSDEEQGAGSGPKWLVRGKMPDGAAMELVVSVSEGDKTIRLITLHFADVLEEVASSAPTKSSVERRVDDWASRIGTLYNLISSWLPIGWSAAPGATVQMQEELMQRFDLLPRELPMLVIRRDGSAVGSIEPRGLWIIGANGRLDFSVKGNKYVILDTAQPFEEPRWHVAPLAHREKLQPLDRETFVHLL